MRAPSVVVAVAACFLALAMSTAGCKRACETSDNCKRTCSCVNAQTNSRLDCTLAIRCDGKEGVCESDYDGLSCNDMCTQYAAKNECGFERCNANEECTKQLTCPLKDANGNPTASQFDCTLAFACDQDQHLCEVASTAPVDQLCAVCDQQRAQQGG